MPMSTTPWVQSLLLLSTRRPPGLTQLREELQHHSPTGNTQPITEEGTIENMEHMPFTHTISHTASKGVRSNLHLSDLSREGPFWPIALQPPLTLLETLGNAVVVAALPAQVPFMLYCVVCGQQDATFSWEISGPYDGEEASSIIISSFPKPVQWQSLSLFSMLSVSTPIRIARIKEAIHPTFEKEGLYFVIAKLNGLESNRLPLSVRIASPGTA